MYFQYWQSSSNQQWYWHLKAANNETIAASEGYVSLANALHAIKIIQVGAATASIHDAKGNKVG